MESKQQGRRRPLDVNASSVTLLDVDQNVSKVFGMAQSRPVTVYRYRIPYAVILSTTMWSGTSKLEDFIPPRSPLKSIRDSIDLELHTRRDSLVQRMRPHMCMEPQQAVRSLLLQVLYSMPTEAMLHSQIMTNMLYRWFVGLQINAPLWQLSQFTQDLRTVLANPEAMELVLETVQAVAASKTGAIELNINIALARAWALRHPSLGSRVPVEDYLGGPTILMPGGKRVNESNADTSSPTANGAQ